MPVGKTLADILPPYWVESGAAESRRASYMNGNVRLVVRKVVPRDGFLTSRLVVRLGSRAHVDDHRA